MAESTSTLRDSLSCSFAFQLPIIWYPNQEDGDIELQVKQMVTRSFATQNFILGRLSADSFLDLLDEQGYDVYDLVDRWEIEPVEGESN